MYNCIHQHRYNCIYSYVNKLCCPKLYNSNTTPTPTSVQQKQYYTVHTPQPSQYAPPLELDPKTPPLPLCLNFAPFRLADTVHPKHSPPPPTRPPTYLRDMLPTPLSVSIARSMLERQAASLRGRRLTPSMGRPVRLATSQHRKVPSARSEMRQGKPCRQDNGGVGLQGFKTLNGQRSEMRQGKPCRQDAEEEAQG